MLKSYHGDNISPSINRSLKAQLMIVRLRELLKLSKPKSQGASRRQVNCA
nr:MAG TPA: hypothetical protein [Caudoviricetes sp.]